MADELFHYGIKRRSGRYPWGSGDEPYQHSGDFIARIKELKKEGYKDKQIAEMFKMSTTDFQTEYKLAQYEYKTEQYNKLKSLRDKGYSTQKISEMTGIPETSVRDKLNSHSLAKQENAKATYNFLKERMKDYPYLDIGSGVEKDLNISRARLDEAVYMLRMEGYKIYDGYQNQVTNPGQQTIYKVLCPIDTEFKEFVTHFKNGEVGSVTEYQAHADGQIFKPKFVYPKSLDSSRLMIRYAEDGGTQMDGLIQLRRGVDDISLGNDRYSQVRILVDDNYYLKGMAAYSDNMPDGVDVIFNTNKTKDKPLEKVLKEIKRDADGNPAENPFGSSIKENGGQHYYIDKNGKEQLSLINKKSEQGDWEDWNDALPSQFLSKQTNQLAEQQLKIAKEIAKADFDEICALTNPTVKQKLLEDFASDCDSSAIHLKAAALPRQKFHVILPFPDMKDNEIYAPRYKDGEEVVLIRYPHGGTFEIPRLIVNNKIKLAKDVIGNGEDAVGVNHNVAARLSGADFDGDTVMVIPTNNGKLNITTKPELEGLKNFEPKDEYGTREQRNSKGEIEYINSYGQPIRIMKNTGNEMGKISNLITDMTLGGATDDELTRAVKHSMVVIDAEKHKLDYKRSEIENNIKALKEKYQKSYTEDGKEKIGGASTLISRAKGQASVTKRQGEPYINIKGKENYDPSRPEGALIYKQAMDNRLYKAEGAPIGKNDPEGYKAYRLADGTKKVYNPKDKKEVDYVRPVLKKDPETGEITITNKTGDLVYRVKKATQKSTQMAETDDARTLISRMNTKMEQIYAEYANYMKALANTARLELVNTPNLKHDPNAAKVYDKEVKELEEEYLKASKNAPRERMAQHYATSVMNGKKQDNPDMTKDEISKLETQTLQKARERFGAARYQISITDAQWEAIQAGAVTHTKLKDILKYSDMKVIRQKSMPKSTTSLTPAQQANLISKYNSGKLSLEQLASQYNISVSTISKIVKGKE